MNTVQDLQNSKIGPPETISYILQGGWAIRTLKTAVEISLFEALLDGPRDAAAVATQLCLPPVGIELMLNALVGLKLLNRADLAGKPEVGQARGVALYALNDESSLYLVKGSPLYAGLYLKQHDELEKMWRYLPGTITSGKPVMEVNTDSKAEEIFPRLAEAIIPINYAVASDVVRFIKNMDPQFTRPLKVLDLACGSAAWSIPFARDNGKTIISGLDFPAVLTVAERTTERFGVAEQYKYLPGNWRQIELEAEHYDLVILGHILHSEGKKLSADLLAYCAAALRPGGILVIAEYMTNTERTAPLYSLMFGLNMYLATTEGCIFSVDELSRMCLAAGFSDVVRHSAPQYDSPVLLAIK